MIGEAERAEIAALRAQAEANPLMPEFLERASHGFDPADPSTRPAPELERFIPLNFTIDLPLGFRVSFTMELQPAGLCRHISASVDAPNRVPHPAALQMLLAEFGFENPLGIDQKIYAERYGSALTAINVIERVTGP